MESVSPSSGSAVAKSASRGFTLIELLVVIAIIGILSSVILASLSTARTKGQIAAAKADMSTFVKAVTIAQGEGSKRLMTMSAEGGSTSSNCSHCSCPATDLRNISSGTLCYVNWIGVLTGVQNNTGGLVTNLTSMTRDPWGSPYLVDENQGEGGIGNCNSFDSIKSAGPDGIKSNSDDIAGPQIPLSPTCP